MAQEQPNQGCTARKENALAAQCLVMLMLHMVFFRAVQIFYNRDFDSRKCVIMYFLCFERFYNSWVRQGKTGSGSKNARQREMVQGRGQLFYLLSFTRVESKDPGADQRRNRRLIRWAPAIWEVLQSGSRQWLPTKAKITLSQSLFGYTNVQSTLVVASTPFFRKYLLLGRLVHLTVIH